MAWLYDRDLVPGATVTISVVPRPYGFWAQCLEYDMGGDGTTPEEAVARLRETAARVDARSLPLAPSAYWWPEVPR